MKQNELERWRYHHDFKEERPHQTEKERREEMRELHEAYPPNTGEVIAFLRNILQRRQAIVDYLSNYPELNDHGFFMVICKVYMDTYRGVGHTNDRITQLIQVFSTSDISRATAARTLHKATKAGVFTINRDPNDRRKQRYYLHKDMITLCSDAFAGMLEDAKGE